VNESSVQNVPEVTSVEKTLDAASSNAVAQARKYSAKEAKNKAVIKIGAGEIASSNELSSKAKSSASAAPARQESTENTDQVKLKNSGLAEATPPAEPAAIVPEMPAAVVAAPPTVAQGKAVVATAPAANASTYDVAVATTKGELAKEHQAENDASLKIRREDIVTKKSADKADVLGASAPKSMTKSEENLALLVRIKNEGGKVVANQDVQAGNFRLLKVEVQSIDLDRLNNPQLTGQALAIDALTGYKIESIGSCGASDSLLREVEAYNQAMRDWHSNHAR
jgi:hypothetical protein